MNRNYSIGFFFLMLSCMCILSISYRISYENQYEKLIAEQKKEEKKENLVEAKGSVSKADIFILKELNGFVAVYLQDGSTIYEYTNIVVDQLPFDVKKEIKIGKQIQTLEELYGFLENYSS